ncbi:hypothetical protein SAMN04489761_2033 [Tenacibaculum sp. MAR_2009_124]|nr:hypothetical protein SAMN04489761_2033 [Tenacibaculum sp. MAR_2009_124]
MWGSKTSNKSFKLINYEKYSNEHSASGYRGIRKL